MAKVAQNAVTKLLQVVQVCRNPMENYIDRRGRILYVIPLNHPELTMLGMYSSYTGNSNKKQIPFALF